VRPDVQPRVPAPDQPEERVDEILRVERLALAGRPSVQGKPEVVQKGRRHLDSSLREERFLDDLQRVLAEDGLNGLEVAERHGKAPETGSVILPFARAAAQHSASPAPVGSGTAVASTSSLRTARGLSHYRALLPLRHASTESTAARSANQRVTPLCRIDPITPLRRSTSPLGPSRCARLGFPPHGKPQRTINLAVTMRWASPHPPHRTVQQGNRSPNGVQRDPPHDLRANHDLPERVRFPERLRQLPSRTSNPDPTQSRSSEPIRRPATPD
jgi:hypothetical protein